MAGLYHMAPCECSSDKVRRDLVRVRWRRGRDGDLPEAVYRTLGSNVERVEAYRCPRCEEIIEAVDVDRAIFGLDDPYRYREHYEPGELEFLLASPPRHDRDFN